MRGLKTSEKKSASKARSKGSTQGTSEWETHHVIQDEFHVELVAATDCSRLDMLCICTQRHGQSVDNSCKGLRCRVGQCHTVLQTKHIICYPVKLQQASTSSASDNDRNVVLMLDLPSLLYMV